MHKLLERQLQRHFGSLDAVPESLKPLIDMIHAAYDSHDQDRELLERSMEISSEELVERNIALSISESSLKAANQRLEELNRFRTQFVSNAAHELGTPLTPIKLQIHLLKSMQNPDAQRKALQILERNIDRLADLVKDILDSAKLQADRLKIDVKPVDVAKPVRDAVEAFHGAASAAGVQLELEECPPGTMAMTDPKRIGQVLFNLLSNALKFTPRGGLVRVSARVEGERVVVSVADSGAGISEENIARLFQPFTQVHDPMQVTHSGTGLGLYICKGIVEAGGGRIWCESKGIGQGATFFVALPVAPRPAPRAEAAALADQA